MVRDFTKYGNYTYASCPCKAFRSSFVALFSPVVSFDCWRTKCTSAQAIAAIHTRNSSISFYSSKTVFLVGCNEQILTSNYIQCLRRLFFKEQLYRQFSWWSSLLLFLYLIKTTNHFAVVKLTNLFNIFITSLSSEHSSCSYDKYTTASTKFIR